ncbi:hypothetical protein CRYUN_Cryun13aG0106900 [Craigia yunnanensis]
MHSLMGCFCLKKVEHKSGYKESIILASETPFEISSVGSANHLNYQVLGKGLKFALGGLKSISKIASMVSCHVYASITHQGMLVTVNEVEALYDPFKKLSSTIIDDGLIHKEEFQLALFKNSSKQNLFADRVFDLFDGKCNEAIEFGEFVRSLSVFHPSAPEADKIAFLFRLYELRQTGYIEREELKEMVLALLSESNLSLSNDVVESIVEKTMMDVDSEGDGKIDEEEWRKFVKKNPYIIKNMTLPYLKELTLTFPSFVLSTEVPD